MPVVAADVSTQASADANGQAISDAMASAGVGGAVTINRPGTYDCWDATHYRHVTLSLADGVTLRHPDGTTEKHILRARQLATSGSITSGSTLLTVTDAAIFQVGALLSIAEAGPLYDSVRLRHYATVLDVSGTTVTLDTPAVATVSGVNVNVGADMPVLEGGTLDGNRQPGGAVANPFPVRWEHVVGGRISGTTVMNGDHGAVMLTFGSRLCLIEDFHFADCGDPANRLGAAIWFFRAALANRAVNGTISGDCYCGVIVDDRTTSVTVYDGVSDGCRIERVTMTLDRNGSNVGAIVNGSSRCKLRRNTVSGPHTAFQIAGGSQGTERATTGNVVEANTISHVEQAVYLGTSGNRVVGNVTSDVPTVVEDVAGGNTVEDSDDSVGAVARRDAIWARLSANTGRAT